MHNNYDKLIRTLPSAIHVESNSKVGKSKSGFGFKTGFETFAKSVGFGFGFGCDLNVFNMEDLDKSFLKVVDLDLIIGGFGFEHFNPWVWIWIWI